jgi:hypothetical protein
VASQHVKVHRRQRAVGESKRRTTHVHEITAVAVDHSPASQNDHRLHPVPHAENIASTRCTTSDSVAAVVVHQEVGEHSGTDFEVYAAGVT